MKNRKTAVAAGAAAVLAVLGGVAVASADGGAEDSAERPEAAITGSALELASQAALDHLGEGRVTDTEVGDEDSYYEVEVTLDDGRQVDVQLDEGFAVVGDEYETGSEDDASEGVGEDADDPSEDRNEGPDVAITGGALAQASEAALAVVQEEFGQTGTVSATEVGDEESYYEVEVTLDDGRQVDVQLDEDFAFVGFD